MALVNCETCGVCFEKANCHIRTSPRHFCCQSCAAKTLNKEHPKRKLKERMCKGCGCVFVFKDRRRSRYCPVCSESRRNKAAFQTLTLADCAARPSVKNKHPSWKWAYVRALNRTWNKHLCTVCAICGYGKGIQLCHRRSISSFPLSATVVEVNAESNNIPLCPNHHWEFDHGLLDADQIAALTVKSTGL